MTQTEASCKHKLPHKEHCLTLKIFHPNEELKSPYTWDTWRATSFPYTECEYSVKSWLHSTLTFHYTQNKFFIMSSWLLFLGYWYK